MAVSIQKMMPSHVVDLVALHKQSIHDYSQYFTPFSFDAPTFCRFLELTLRDLYFIVLADDQVAGFYMLRGLDEGYAAPMYGVWIGDSYSGRGLALTTLRHAVSVCAELQCRDLLLKVHPDNLRAKSMYERFGFVSIGTDIKTQNLVYRLSL